MYDSRRGGSVFGAFLLGGLVGAVLGLLFAPRSGKETRDILTEKAEEYWGEGVEIYHTGVEKASGAIETGKEKVAESSEQMRAKIDEARDRLKEQVAKSAETAKGKVGEAVPAAIGAVDKAAEATRYGVETAGSKAQETLDFVAKKAKSDDMMEADVVVVTDDPSRPEL